jgi:hypothetical protein
MNKKITDVIYDTNTLSGLVVIFIIYLVPATVFCLLSPDRILSALVVIMEGLFAARIVRNLGIFFLREPIEPWYARSWSLTFLLICGPLVNVFFIWVDCLAATISPVDDIPQWARILALIPIEFAWIILLDWRSGDNRANHPPNWTYIPKNPHF